METEKEIILLPEKKRYKIRTELEKQFKINRERYLELENLLDEENNLIICPFCFNPSVKYLERYKEWCCGQCKVEIKFTSILHEIDLDGKEMYKIYKLWGIKALHKLTGKAESVLQNSVGKYFENCCSSKGEKCLYFDYIKEIKISKRIETISILFENAKSNYESLNQGIEELSELIEEYSDFLPDEEKFKIENKYEFLKNNVEQITSSLDDHLIVPTKDNLKKNQRVYIEEFNDEFVAFSQPQEGFESEIEGFAWNEAKQGEPVGVFFVQHDFHEELNQSILELKKQIREYTVKWSFGKLSPLELEALKIIIEENGIFQNHLWRKLQVDSRKCSRVVNRLLKEDLIARETAISNGARTYLLKVFD